MTLHVAQKVGMEAVAQNAIAFHMVETMPRVLPAALGAVDTTVLREAGAYASLAAGGHEVVPTLIDSVQDPDGHVVWRPSAITCDNCADRASAPALTDQRKEIADAALGVPDRHHDAGRDAARHRRARGGRARPADRRQDRHHAGFHRRLVLGLHARSGDHRLGRLRQSGDAGQQRDRWRRSPAPIWHDYMAVALADRPVLTFPQPPGVTMAQLGHRFRHGDRRVQAGPGPGRLATDRRRVASAPGGSDGSTPADARSAVHGGVDSSLGGLY